jgi:hypothetical protein
MAVAKARYIQLVALIVISGLTIVAWFHLPRLNNGCKNSSRITQFKLDCSADYMLCGVKDHLPDFNTLRSDFHALMTTIDFKCPTTLRFGRAGDGGYEACMTKTVRPNNNSCLVYSFGISKDWSFDEAWAKYGCEVHSFDPSIGLQDHMHSPNVTFHNSGLWGSDHNNSKGWKLERFSTIKNRLGHKERIIDALKIDVEGGEWPFLRDVTYTDPTGLSNVRQLYIELHTPKFRSDGNMTSTDFAEVNEYVRRLRDDLDFFLYKNVQRNNCCGRFSDLMPPGVPQRCCHELFFFNSNLIAG